MSALDDAIAALDVVGYRAEHHPSCQGDCGQCPIQVHVSGEELATVLRAAAQIDALADVIEPGDLVEHIDKDLDPREVVALGRDWLVLDILGRESPRLPRANYRVSTKRRGVF
jgi:hypothetical protein